MLLKSLSVKDVLTRPPYCDEITDIIFPAGMLCQPCCILVDDSYSLSYLTLITPFQCSCVLIQVKARGWRLIEIKLKLLFFIDLKLEKTYKNRRGLQVIIKKLQELSSRVFWGSVLMEVWSARDHFVPLMLRLIKSSVILPKDFLLAWFQKSFEKRRS